ncbi:MAG TPA: oligosaccharide flippase family protein, partial [Candidatus Thermoplasmatota archaeon]|nr:oligosaccharide flippase family protein [Candidatus Thermoplasmatota archaeon]
MQRASLLFGASFLLNAAFGYLFHLLLGRVLTVADFGLVVFLESVLGICGLALVNGYPPLTTRLLSHAGDDRRSAILRRTLTYNLLLAALFAGALVGLWWLGVLDVGGAGLLLVALLCATLLLTAAGAILKATLQGEFRFERASAVLVAEQAVKLGAGIALAVAGLTVVGAMVSLALAAAVGVVLALVLLPSRMYRRGGRAPDGIAAMGLPMFLG